VSADAYANGRRRRMSDVNQAAELTHLRERVKELERERGEIIADAKVLRAEVDAWRDDEAPREVPHRIDTLTGRIAATDARGILTNPLYQTPTSGGEHAK